MGSKEGVALPESVAEMEYRKSLFYGQCKECTEVICENKACRFWWLYNGLEVAKRPRRRRA